MKFDAVFFDFDGVLVLSEPLHLFSWQTVLKEKNLDPNLLKYEDIIGVCDRIVAKNIKKKFNLKHDIDELLLQKEKVFKIRLNDKILYPKGRNKFLKYLKDNDYVLAIVSNSTFFEIKSILKNQRIDFYFDCIISIDDCIKAKPHPEPYLKALRKVSCDASKVLAIEDSKVGIEAARRANICCYQLDNRKFKQENIPYFEDFQSLLNFFSIPLVNEDSSFLLNFKNYKKCFE